MFVSHNSTGPTIAPSAYSLGDDPGYPSSSPHLPPVFIPSGRGNAQQNRNIGDRLPAALDFRGYGSMVPPNGFPAPHVSGDYYGGWSGNQLPNNSPGASHLFTSTTGNHLAPATITPGTLAPIASLPMSSNPFISPHLTSRDAAYSLLYASDSDRNAAGGPRSSSLHSTGKAEISMTLPLDSIVNSPHALSSRNHSPSVHSRSHTSTASPPLHANMPSVAHNVYSHGRDDSGHNQRSVSSSSLPVNPNINIHDGARHDDYPMHITRHSSSNVQNWAHLTGGHGYTNRNEGLQHWKRE